MDYTLVSLGIIVHPLEYCGRFLLSIQFHHLTHLALWSYDDQTHLSVHRQQLLIDNYSLPVVS